jgi:hypothetical protein
VEDTIWTKLKGLIGLGAIRSGLLVTLAMLPRPTSGQEAAQPDTRVPAATAQAEGGSSFWGAVVGSRSERRRLVPGLWVLHPYDPKFPEIEWTQGFALQVDQWFAATFINSYGDRSFMAGVERNWASAQTPVARFGIGYRVGLLTGYDQRLMPIAEHTPVLPFVGVLLWTDVGPFGLDAYYVYEAISLEIAIRFQRH